MAAESVARSVMSVVPCGKTATRVHQGQPGSEIENIRGPKPGKKAENQRPV